MFGHRHYVPVMRAKPAELRALRDLAPALRQWTTPLIECPPRAIRKCDSLAKLDATFAAILNYIAGWSERNVFFDFGLIKSVAPQSIEAMARLAAAAGIRPVPVVSIATSIQSAYGRSIHTALQRHGASLGLRIGPATLALSSIGEMLQQWLVDYGVSTAQVDLIVDRGGIDNVSLTYPEFAHRIPFLDDWRTTTVLAGSFPKDLAGLAKNQAHRLRRFEFRQWQAMAKWNRRLPAFGDFAIQHVLFKEPVPVPNVSASVRYTTENEFLVLRGEGVMNERGPGRGQWSAWASLLTEMPEFFGGSFSAGDQYVVERAADWRNPGTAQSWLQAAFNHHLTTTALQVAGRLAKVREVAASARDWTTVVDLNRPEANL